MSNATQRPKSAEQSPKTPPFIIRDKNLKPFYNLSPSTAYRMVDSGMLPTRRRFGPGVVGWLREEFEECLRNQSEEIL